MTSSRSKVREAFLAMAILVWVVPSATFAQNWPLGEGGYRVTISGTGSLAEEMYDLEGTVVDFPGKDVAEFGGTLTYEGGFSPNWTLLVALPWKQVRVRNDETSVQTRGFADGDFRLRWAPVSGSTAFFADFGAIVPLGYDESDRPQIGSGGAGWLVSCGLSTKIPAVPGGFFSIDAGYRWRRGYLWDEIPAGLEIGMRPHKSFGITLFGRGWLSMADFDEAISYDGMTVEDSERISAGVRFDLSLATSFDLFLSGSRVLHGTNAPKSDEVSAGIVFKGLDRR